MEPDTTRSRLRGGSQLSLTAQCLYSCMACRSSGGIGRRNLRGGQRWCRPRRGLAQLPRPATLRKSVALRLIQLRQLSTYSHYLHSRSPTLASPRRHLPPPPIIVRLSPTSAFPFRSNNLVWVLPYFTPDYILAIPPPISFTVQLARCVSNQSVPTHQGRGQGLANGAELGFGILKCQDIKVALQL